MYTWFVCETKRVVRFGRSVWRRFGRIARPLFEPSPMYVRSDFLRLENRQFDRSSMGFTPRINTQQRNSGERTRRLPHRSISPFQPDRDHTEGSKTGFYVHVPSSSSDQARLISPVINSNSTGCRLVFYYHMNGDGVGNLSVYVRFYGNGPLHRIFNVDGRRIVSTEIRH